MSYYNLSSQETLEKLESSENGLSQNEVDIRLQKSDLTKSQLNQLLYGNDYLAHSWMLLC